MKRYFAELTGTFVLVFAGTGAVITNDLYSGVVTHVGISITFGLVVMTMIYAIGDTSGAHINPAVTIGFWLSRRMPGRDVAGYIGSQTAGGVLASLLLHYLYPAHTSLGMTLPAITISSAFLLEIILTFILMFVIINVATGSKEKGLMAGVAIGATVGLESMFAGPVTGASMNPARSFAPALISGNLEHLWVYLTAPLIGAALAVACWHLIKD